MNSGHLMVSVVISAFNEETGLATCVQRIREACDACTSISHAYEIIVCDNNSTDGTAAIAERCGCKVVFEPVNQIVWLMGQGGSSSRGKARIGACEYSGGVLHKHPFSTSGRKGMAYDIGAWMKFALRLCLSFRKSVRDKEFAAKWYEADR